MVTFRRLSLLALALSITAVGTMSQILGSHAATVAGPRVTVVAQVSNYHWLTGHATTYRQITFHITGSNFVPGSDVGIALLNTVHWTVLARGSTQAQGGFVAERCGRGHEGCSQHHPRVGTIDYRMGLDFAPSASNLMLLYRAPGDAGTRRVTLP